MSDVCNSVFATHSLSAISQYAHAKTQFWLALSPSCTIITTVRCKVGCSRHVTRCNWLRNVAKSRRLFNFFCYLLCNFSLCCKLQRRGSYARNYFCNLFRNGIALLVAEKIASCNRPLIYSAVFVMRLQNSNELRDMYSWHTARREPETFAIPRHEGWL